VLCGVYPENSFNQSAQIGHRNRMKV